MCSSFSFLAVAMISSELGPHCRMICIASMRLARRTASHSDELYIQQRNSFICANTLRAGMLSHYAKLPLRLPALRPRPPTLPMCPCKITGMHTSLSVQDKEFY